MTREVAVSLQGTFDVFSLPELLRMLAASAKTGGLVVEAGGVAGRIDLRDGSCVGVESVEVRGTPATVDELHGRLVDVAFAIVREPTGAFRFAAGEPNGEHEFSVPVEPVLAEVELLVAEWRDLIARIPSMDLRPELVPELAGDAITLSAAEWGTIARCDGLRSVRDLAEGGQRALVEVCRVVAELVDRGALRLVERAGSAEPAGRPEARGDDRHGTDRDVPYYGGRVEPVAPYGPGVDASPARGSRWRAENGVDLVDGDAIAVNGDTPATEVPPVPPAPEPVPVEVGSEAAPAEAPSEAPSEGDPGMVAAAVSTPYGEVADDRNQGDRGAILKLFSALREA